MMTDPTAALAAARPLAIQSDARTALDRARAAAMTPAQIDTAAREFEALFAAQMLQPMFEGLKSDGMFSGGHAEQTWRGFMIEALGEQIAKTGGLGVADAVRAALMDAAGLAHTPSNRAEGAP